VELHGLRLAAFFAAAAAPRVQRRLKRGGGVAQAIRDPDRVKIS